MVQTGLARFEFRHMPLHGQSEFAALATECAADQDAFWAAHDRYMAGGDSSLYRRSGAVAMARELGLDTAEFGACIDEERHIEAIQAQQRAAFGRNIRSSPVLLVDGQRVDATASAVIEAVRAAAE